MGISNLEVKKTKSEFENILKTNISQEFENLKLNTNKIDNFFLTSNLGSKNRIADDKTEDKKKNLPGFH